TVQTGSPWNFAWRWLPCRGAGLRQGFCPTWLFCGFHGRENRHSGSLVGAGFEGNGAVDRGKKGVIDADAHARAGVPFGTPLTDDDVAGDDSFATELLDAQTTAGAIATVAGRAACFL